MIVVLAEGSRARRFFGRVEFSIGREAPRGGGSGIAAFNRSGQIVYPWAYSSSCRRSSPRRIFPVLVLGSSVTKSIFRGYL